MRFLLTMLACILTAASCSAAEPPQATPTAGGPSQSISASPSPSAPPSSSPAPSASQAVPSTSPPPGNVLAVGGAAVTIVDGVRVRSAPSVEDSSVKYEPLLPNGTVLFVLDGPTAGSGYAWWQVVPTAFAGLNGRFGWVAAGSRDGEPWIRPTTVQCPSPPDDLAELVALPVGMALACFSGQPITVQARLVSCNCDIDGPSTEPSWLGIASEPILLVDPDTTTPPDAVDDWFLLHLDPDAGVTAVPVDEVVDVTGMFDHPASEDCLVGGFDEPPSPSMACRFAFAVTAIDEIVGP
jgi:hypothetical protein